MTKKVAKGGVFSIFDYKGLEFLLRHYILFVLSPIFKVFVFILHIIIFMPDV
jgi:hypothetical protein